MSHLLAWIDAYTAGMSWQEMTLRGLSVFGASAVLLFVGYVMRAIWENNNYIPAGKP